MASQRGPPAVAVATLAAEAHEVAFRSDRAAPLSVYHGGCPAGVYCGTKNKVYPRRAGVWPECVAGSTCHAGHRITTL